MGEAGVGCVAGVVGVATVAGVVGVASVGGVTGVVGVGGVANYRDCITDRGRSLTSNDVICIDASLQVSIIANDYAREHST